MGDIIPSSTFYNLDNEKQKRIFDASIKYMARSNYSSLNISDIIKEAKIARGSFYQYFDDKEDLYKYVLDEIGKEKIKFMSDIILDDETPFLDIFEQTFEAGLRFASNNILYVKVYENMLNDYSIYSKLLEPNIDYVIRYFKGLIERDQKNGLINKEVDSYLLAELLVDLSSNISYRTMVNGKFDDEKILKRVRNLVDIYKKGIL